MKPRWRQLLTKCTRFPGWMAAKPLVLYESDDLIAMASEEVAIRAILPHEIDTTDPYDEEIRVWTA